MTKTTRSVIVAAFATLMLILSALLGTFLASDVSGVNESGLSYGLTADEAEKLCIPVIEEIKSRIGSYVYGIDAESIEEIKAVLAEKGDGFVKAMWCGEEECEDKVKELTGVGSRCIPFEQENITDTCICCGKPAKQMVFWGKAY